MEIHLDLLADHPKNVTLWVRGRTQSGQGGAVPLLALAKLAPASPPTRSLLLASAVWLLEEKLALYVWMHEELRRPEDLLLVMESRNSLRYDKELPMHKEWEGGLWLTAGKETVDRVFSFILDFDKVGQR